MKITHKFMRLGDLKPGAIVRHDKSDRKAIIIGRLPSMASVGIPAQSLSDDGVPMGIPYIIFAQDVSEIVSRAETRAQRAAEGNGDGQ